MSGGEPGPLLSVTGRAGRQFIPASPHDLFVLFVLAFFVFCARGIETQKLPMTIGRGKDIHISSTFSCQAPNNPVVKDRQVYRNYTSASRDYITPPVRSQSFSCRQPYLDLRKGLGGGATGPSPALGNVPAFVRVRAGLPRAQWTFGNR